MKRIIFDTDIGTDVDDALALALAAASPEFQIEAVTTVHADAPLRARIARHLLGLAGRADVPVVAGASRPLAMPLPERFHWNPHLRGHEGTGILASDDLRPTRDLDAGADEAAHLIVERAHALRGELALVAVGPLTNVARALRLEPRLRDWLQDLTIMGGLVDPSECPWPPVLETNLNADPEAAAIVFRSGVPLTIVPFEVTTRVFLAPDERAEMRGWGWPLSDVLVTLMEQMQESFAGFSDEVGLPTDIFQGRTYMHDPLAVYASGSSRFVALRRTHVGLAVRDRVLRTIEDVNGTPNVRVCVAVDEKAFPRFWLDRIKRLAAAAA